jgi:hypothetical protein
VPGLGQNVRNLLFSPDVLNFYPPISDALMNEMKSSINVFTSIVEYMILTKSASRPRVSFGELMTDN